MCFFVNRLSLPYGCLHNVPALLFNFNNSNLYLKLLYYSTPLFSFFMCSQDSQLVHLSMDSAKVVVMELRDKLFQDPRSHL